MEGPDLACERCGSEVACHCAEAADLLGFLTDFRNHQMELTAERIAAQKAARQAARGQRRPATPPAPEPVSAPEPAYAPEPVYAPEAQVRASGAQVQASGAVHVPGPAGPAPEVASTPPLAVFPAPGSFPLAAPGPQPPQPPAERSALRRLVGRRRAPSA